MFDGNQTALMHSEEQLRGPMCRMATPVKGLGLFSFRVFKIFFYESYTKTFRTYSSDRTREISKEHPSFASSGWWISQFAAWNEGVDWACC